MMKMSLLLMHSKKGVSKLNDFFKNCFQKRNGNLVHRRRLKMIEQHTGFVENI